MADPLTNPFARRTFDARIVQTCNATDRISKVRRFDATQCRQALELQDLQKTVRITLERRLRKLQKEAHPCPP